MEVGIFAPEDILLRSIYVHMQGCENMTRKKEGVSRFCLGGWTQWEFLESEERVNQFTHEYPDILLTHCLYLGSLSLVYK